MAEDDKTGGFAHSSRDRAPSGADPERWHPETSWAATMMELNAGRFPDLDRIARVLKASDSPAPRPVRDFLADYLTGKRRRPAGRPSADLYERRLMVGVIEAAYQRELDCALEEKAEGRLQGMPSDVAAERLAVEFGMSVGSIRDALHRRNGWEA